MVQTKKKTEPWDELGRKKRKEEGKRSKGKVKKGTDIAEADSGVGSGVCTAAQLQQVRHAVQCSRAGEERKRKRNSPRIARASALDGRTLQSPVVSLPAVHPDPTCLRIGSCIGVRAVVVRNCFCLHPPAPPISSSSSSHLISSVPFRADTGVGSPSVSVVVVCWTMPLFFFPCAPFAFRGIVCTSPNGRSMKG